MAKMKVIPERIPEVIVDNNSGKKYLRGKLCGKGGFAKCYEITDMETHCVFAGKIIPKERLTSSYHLKQMAQEIHIHSSIEHKHIVRYLSAFEDDHFIYVILELCHQKSLKELCSRRKTLTEPEVRYFMKQILDAVQYLHETVHIVHRDLKLANILLNDDLEVKIADFGLATKIEYKGQRKTTFCGTPNYVAPEVLKEVGHSFEVDVWSMGCIMYTMLVGKPPFEMASLQSTYDRIKQCLYILPTSLKPDAAHLVNRMLQPDPKKRPKAQDILQFEFFKGYIPKALPHTCLTVAPREDTISAQESLISCNGKAPETSGAVNDSKILRVKKTKIVRSNDEPKNKRPRISVVPANSICLEYLNSLHKQLKILMKTQLKPRLVDEEELTDPDAQPIVWVSKWLDYTEKYGFGYQLCDDSLGIAFNDNTCIVLLANQRNVHYIECDGTENYYTLGKTPEELEKKVKLLHYFRKYMRENLVKAGDSVTVQESCHLSRTSYLYRWQRCANATVMQLTNGTLQVNFQDHTKIIMCPLMQAVTYIDEQKKFLTYKFSTIIEHGCSQRLYRCLVYACRWIEKIVKAPG